MLCIRWSHLFSIMLASAAIGVGVMELYHNFSTYLLISLLVLVAVSVAVLGAVIQESANVMRTYQARENETVPEAENGTSSIQ